MKLLSWNLNHRIREKPIPRGVVDVIQAINPDVFSLTEFVDGPSRTQFYAALKSSGYSWLATTSHGPKRHNQVLIASREPMERRECVPPIELGDAFQSGAIQVHLPKSKVNVLAVRILDFKNAEMKRGAWDWLLEQARVLKASPSVILGDLNTDFHYSAAKGGPRMQALADLGFERAAPPADEFSYRTLNGKPCRIDHAFVSPSLRRPNARYVSETNGIILRGDKPAVGLSDHAAIVLEVEV